MRNAIENTLARVETYFADHDSSAKWLRIVVQVYTGIVFPLIVVVLGLTIRALIVTEDGGSSGGGGSTGWISPWTIVWLIGIPALLLQGVALYLLTFRWNAAPSYFDFVQLRDGYSKKKAELEERIGRIEGQLGAALQMQETTRYATVALDSIRDLAALDGDAYNDAEQAVGVVMAPVVSFRAELFGFTGSELFNFAYYEFRPERGKLELVWRECHERIERSDRSWAPGMGHVGLCYSRRRDLFSTDVRESETLSDDQSEEDNNTYVSLASIPVFELGHFQTETSSGDTPPPPIGVLVLTSSKPNQFDKNAHRTFLLTVSYLLTLALERVVLPKPTKTWTSPTSAPPQPIRSRLASMLSTVMGSRERRPT